MSLYRSLWNLFLLLWSHHFHPLLSKALVPSLPQMVQPHLKFSVSASELASLALNFRGEVALVSSPAPSQQPCKVGEAACAIPHSPRACM